MMNQGHLFQDALKIKHFRNETGNLKQYTEKRTISKMVTLATCNKNTAKVNREITEIGKQCVNKIVHQLYNLIYCIQIDNLLVLGKNPKK